MDALGDASVSTSTPLMRVDVVGSGYESDGELEEDDAMGDGRDDGRDDDDETRPFAARTRSTYVGVLRRASTSMSAWTGERAIGIESLDFNDVDSTWSRRRGTSLWCPSVKWIVAASIGLCVGCAAFAIDVGIRGMYRARRALFEAAAREAREGDGARGVAGASVGAALAAGAGAATIYGAPNAKGAGVHYVMAVLNGIHVPNAFSLNVVVVKAIATVLSVGSGLMIGPEGPLVHIGAGVAMQFVHGASGTADLFQSDLDRSDFVSAGVARSGGGVRRQSGASCTVSRRRRRFGRRRRRDARCCRRPSPPLSWRFYDDGASPDTRR